MKKTGLAIFGIILVAGAITAYSAVFTVHQTQQALILQFGNPVDVASEPGLNFKMPFIQDVRYFDRRILVDDVLDAVLEKMIKTIQLLPN